MLQLSDKFESQKILSLLTRALPYYLKSWHDLDETHGLFGALDPQTHNMRSMSISSPVIEYVIRPHLQVLYIFSAYLGSPETIGLLESACNADKVRDMIVKGIRWACDTHLTGTVDVDSFLERKRWGENWRSGLWASLLGLCGHLAGSLLPDELKTAIARVIAFEADRFIGVLPPSGCEVDTKVEENAQDTLVLAWALNLCQSHEHHALWEQALHTWAVNIATCITDKTDHSDYFGKSLSSWISTETLFPDMTAENHDFFQPEVLTYGMWIVLSMAVYSLYNKEIPEFLTRKNHQETFDVLLRFCLPNGMLYMPGGQDIPFFIPRPFALAWGLWNNDPRALLLTEKMLAWMESMLLPTEANPGPWVFGLPQAYEGWELFFQSQAGF
jgi:hypothetical protein